ncbi:MAG: low molecular weight phosphotyrosine protein phosphatase [Oscillospiraceae bacterium]|nr:low molecular weight phosphotyrosine protein phosphatase [Oscillospiraceae bacterium]
MIKSIMFVCHGNICRSPMAEFIMKDLVKKECPDADIFIASSATSTEEIGNPVYPPARAELNRRGVPCGGRQAVQVKKSDYGKYDLFLVMDGNNVRNIMRIFGSDPDGKVRRLSEFSGGNKDISDPWYSGRFDVAFDDIYRGCVGLLEHIRREN